jgi:hypothetical protein
MKSSLNKMKNITQMRNGEKKDKEVDNRTNGDMELVGSLFMERRCYRSMTL